MINFSLLTIFALCCGLELVDESLGVTTNAIGLQIYGGPAVTVLASKTSRKFTCYSIY